jgi:hypothetical protein
MELNIDTLVYIIHGKSVSNTIITSITRWQIQRLNRGMALNVLVLLLHITLHEADPDKV